MARYDAPSRRRGGQKQNTFFGGAAILAVGILVVKLIGMFYKIPLVNIIGAQGNTDFTNAYNIYAVLLSISTAGLPVAVSKLVSEANAQGRRCQVRRTLQLSLILFLALGAVSFLVMFFKADLLAGMMHDSKAAPGIQALAPAVVCVGCLAALRGYSQGHLNMTPTSVSQIIEALCKLVIGLSLAWWLISAGNPPEIAAAGAITGVTVGTVAALIYMVINFFAAKAREPRLTRDVPDSAADILGDILRIAIPITLSSSMVGIVTVIDSSLVQGQLQRVLLETPACWDLYRTFLDFAPLEQAISSWKAALPAGTAATMSVLTRQVDAAQAAGTALSGLDSAAVEVYGLLESMSRSLYGNYGGALNIYNLPISLMAAITASVIPAVSGALARRDRREASRMSGSAMRITALLVCPMGIGLFVMGRPIMQLLYPALELEIAGPLLSTLGLATAFVCMMMVCNSILQAHGFVNLPVLVMLLGGGVKIFANYHAVAMPQVGIYGAPVGNILCFSLCLAMDLVLIARVIPRRPQYLDVFLKPLMASAVMGVTAWAVNGLSSKICLSMGQKSLEAAAASGAAPGGLGGRLCVLDQAAGQVLGLSRMGCALTTLGAIGVAMIVYLALVIVLRAITRDDLSLMPKGDKIARLLGL
ncbi:polysaccharide biosynthesis protein [Pseudoflavonifractor sp. 60]|uniref:putative polysaccharide biosynthesis protein n=1 Tax=Pseudoflavonifractor sp. 60 TaxID=2304576 RepID=UPI0013683752|nr:polysaccharide biosynthesis protein [Pseudoflavonifractor sp. 60]NBI68760.1 polysaccharide biosynthesis protein [Pseudoflavonifractor sp. 60]